MVGEVIVGVDAKLRESLQAEEEVVVKEQASQAELAEKAATMQAAKELRVATAETNQKNLKDLATEIEFKKATLVEKQAQDHDLSKLEHVRADKVKLEKAFRESYRKLKDCDYQDEET